jgi:ubiquinone/menaquinone biosynthesis C-methylase UbiE
MVATSISLPNDNVYHGLHATTWDLSRGDTSNWDDRYFYLDVLRRYGQPVLDVGCGTGRLILDYLALGIDCDGVDNASDMLAICRAKAARSALAPNLHEQPIESLALPRRYKTILGPSSVFQLVTDPDVARTALQRLFGHLEPGGAFVTSFSFDWRPGEPLDTGWAQRFEKIRPADGAIVRCWTREWREPARQWWHTEERFEVVRDGAVVETQHRRCSPEGRWYGQAEVVALFRDVGFRDVQLFHEFTHEPAGEDDRLFCVLGVKPSA